MVIPWKYLAQILTGCGIWKLNNLSCGKTLFLIRLSVSRTFALSWAFTFNVSLWRCAKFRSFKSRCYQIENLLRHNNMHAGLVLQQSLSLSMKMGLQVSHLRLLSHVLLDRSCQARTKWRQIPIHPHGCIIVIDRQPSPNHTLNTGSAGGCEVVAAGTEAVVAALV
jgi:hypothetical protein